MIEVVIDCDMAACEALAAARTIADVRKMAKAAGWTIRKDGKTFCPRHLSETTARCEGCGAGCKFIRPRGHGGGP